MRSKLNEEKAKIQTVYFFVGGRGAFPRFSFHLICLVGTWGRGVGSRCKKIERNIFVLWGVLDTFPYMNYIKRIMTNMLSENAVFIMT